MLKKFNALIDNGALFKDIKQLELAKEILASQTDLEAVVFFDGDRQMILKRGETTPVSFNKNSDIDPSKRFTIYDQAHCRGIHIDQYYNAQFWITENKNSLFSDDEQALFRMRGFAKSQKGTYIVPEDLYAIVQQQSGQAQPDVLDLAIFLKRSQGAQKGEDNVMALKQKLGNCIFNACDAYLDEIRPEDLSQPIFKELEALLSTKILDDIAEQYSEVGQLEDCEKVFKAYTSQLLQKFREWREKYTQDPLYKPLDIEKIEAEMFNLITEAKNKKYIADKLPMHTKSASQGGQDLSLKVQVEIQQQQQTTETVQTQELTSLLEGRGEGDPFEGLNGPNLQGMFSKDYYAKMKFKQEDFRS